MTGDLTGKASLKISCRDLKPSSNPPETPPPPLPLLYPVTATCTARRPRHEPSPLLFNAAFNLIMQEIEVGLKVILSVSINQSNI